LSRARKHFPARGFTLIEMLVALAIVAIALSTISSSFVSLVSNSGTLKDRMLGRWIAENRLAQIHLETPWPGTGEREGSIEYAGLKWQWTEHVRASSDPDFRHIQVDVRRTDEPDDLTTIVGYARNPHPAKPGTTP